MAKATNMHACDFNERIPRLSEEALLNLNLIMDIEDVLDDQNRKSWAILFTEIQVLHLCIT